MKTWTTETWVAGAPEQVLELLTAPDAIARWAPIPFDLLDLDGDRLGAGTRARVSGRGLLGGILARAFEAVLAAGALRASVARIGRELEPALA